MVGDPVIAAKIAAAGLVQGQPFTDNVIPATLFDPNAVIYLNTGIVPHPNAPNDQFIGQASLPINVRDDVVRIDHRVNEKWQILGHYIHDSAEPKCCRAHDRLERRNVANDHQCLRQPFQQCSP